jgi:hypothetical protein
MDFNKQKEVWAMAKRELNRAGLSDNHFKLRRRHEYLIFEECSAPDTARVLADFFAEEGKIIIRLVE